MPNLPNPELTLKYFVSFRSSRYPLTCEPEATERQGDGGGVKSVCVQCTASHVFVHECLTCYKKEQSLSHNSVC